MEESYNFFMEANVENYIDEWVAVVDSEIVSHGKNVEKVIKEAKRKYPKKKPLITRVPGKETMIL